MELNAVTWYSSNTLSKRIQPPGWPHYLGESSPYVQSSTLKMFVVFALFWGYWQSRRVSAKCDFGGCRTIIPLLTFTTFLAPDVMAEGSYFWISRGIGLGRHPSPTPLPHYQAQLQMVQRCMTGRRGSYHHCCSCTGYRTTVNLNLFIVNAACLNTEQSFNPNHKMLKCGNKWWHMQ